MIEKCSCGTEPVITFGFSCTFKPKVDITCPKCGKCVSKIDNGGTSVYELWKEAIKNQ